MKICNKCNVEKEISNFCVRNKKTGCRRTECNACLYLININTHIKNRKSENRLKWGVENREKNNSKTRERYHKNPQKKLAKNKIWREKNPERQKELVHNHYECNKDKWREKGRKWNQNHPEEIRAKASGRRAIKKQRSLSKNSKENKKQINKIFKTAKDLEELNNTKYHVDHIIPLINDNVCGLHVPWNLQVLVDIDNINKSNKFDGTNDNESWRKDIKKE